METRIEEITAGPDGSAALSWDRFVAGHRRAHFLQSWGWGELRREQGWRIHRLWAISEEGPVAAAQLLERKRRGGWVAYLPRGPVCEPDEPALDALLGAMRAHLRGRAVALRVEPHWPDEPAQRSLLSAVGMRPAQAVQPPSTLCLDLRQSEDALLAGMKQKWRYNVRLAARKGVLVERVGAEALPEFEALMAATAARQSFPGRPAGYHASAFAALGEGAHLYRARYEQDTLAMILVVHFGRVATYLYGASSERERSRMPNHALQWAAMRDAMAAGLSSYDLWGIPDEIGVAAMAGEDPDAVPPGEGGLWGVWRFKRGFGGEVWRSVGAWDDVYAPLRYGAARALARVRGS